MFICRALRVQYIFTHFIFAYISVMYIGTLKYFSLALRFECVGLCWELSWCMILFYKETNKNSETVSLSASSQIILRKIKMNNSSCDLEKYLSSLRIQFDFIININPTCYTDDWVGQLWNVEESFRYELNELSTDSKWWNSNTTEQIYRLRVMHQTKQ